MRMLQKISMSFVLLAALALTTTPVSASTCPAKCELDPIDPGAGYFCAIYYVLITGCESLDPGLCDEDYCFGGELVDPEASSSSAPVQQACSKASKGADAADNEIRVVRVEHAAERT